MKQITLFRILICFLHYFIHSIVESKNFKIGLMIPDKCCYRSLGYETSASAISLAIENARADGFMQNDTWSVEKVSVDDISEQARLTVELITVKNVDVIIGHPLSTVNLPIAYVTSSYNFPHLSWSSTSSSLSDKTIFRTLIRTAPTFTAMSAAILNILKFFDWTIVSMLIHNDGLLCKFAADGLTQAFSTTNISLKVYALFESTASKHEFIQHLKNVKNVSRIVIMCGRWYLLRTIMLAACRLQMCNGDFVFIDPKFSLTDVSYTPWIANDKDDEAAREAFKHVLHLNMAYWYDEESKVKNEELRNAIPYHMTLPPWNSTYAVDNGLNATFFSMFLYDCAYLIAMWWDHAMKNNIYHKNGNALFEWTTSVKFDGGSRKVRFSDNADPIPMFWIEDLKGQGDERRILGVVESYKPNDSVTLWTDPLWMTEDGKPPPSVPLCGFDGNACESQQMEKESTLDMIIGLTCGLFVVFAASLTFLYFIRKLKFEKDILKMVWKINYNDIFFTSGVEAFSTSMTSRLSVCSNKTPFSMNQSGKKAVGRYNGQLVFVKKLPKVTINLTPHDLVALKKMRDFLHNNVNPFVGACIDGPVNCTVFAYGQKGSLQDILENHDIKLEWMFKLALIKDLASASVLKSHGRLKSSNCIVDSKWSLKITDYGISTFHNPIVMSNLTKVEDFHALLWTAPEVLRKDNIALGTRKGDVYSFGIIIHEICYRSGVFPVPLQSPKDIIRKLRNDHLIPCRPPLFKDIAISGYILELMKQSWNEDPAVRPDFCDIVSYIKAKFPDSNRSIMDTMLTMLEKYANNLEDIVRERTMELDEEKQKTDRLLYKMIPREIADRLKKGEAALSESFEAVTIYFSDIVGFTTISAAMTAPQVVDFLNDLYTKFDDIISRFDVYKVETIGDAYMVASGVPIRNGEKHADQIAKMAICILKRVKDFTIKGMPNQPVNVRIGIHTGPVCAGVIGLTMPRYCLFGDTVNTASRMESNGLPQRVHISRKTKEALERFGTFCIIPRGEMEIKGKGKMETFFLHDRPLNSVRKKFKAIVERVRKSHTIDR